MCCGRSLTDPRRKSIPRTTIWTPWTSGQVTRSLRGTTCGRRSGCDATVAPKSGSALIPPLGVAHRIVRQIADDDTGTRPGWEHLPARRAPNNSGGGMIALRRLPRMARWGVPAGAVALTGVVVAGFAMSGAQAAPSLPSRTPVQLLAAVNSARVLPPMTAVIQESAALGIPDLPSFGSGDPLSALSWLSGSHTVKIWYADQ